MEDKREDYNSPPLLEADIDPDPIEQCRQWLFEAWDMGVAQPDAMVLATADGAQRPSARAVIIRSIDHGFVFYTNVESRKGVELAENPRAAGCFLWASIHRQVRIEGEVERLPSEEADAYFVSRPRGSQISAAVSPQSQVVESREELEAVWRRFEDAHPDGVARPPHWGGYRLIPDEVEFWQGRANRFHDRLRYRRSGPGWKIERLAP